MKHDLQYDGTKLTWRNRRTGKESTYRATSGLPEHQKPQFQCFPDKGPIPEGTYVLRLDDGDHTATDDGSGRCNLQPSHQLQTIPRGAAAGECEPYWANWGWNRIRIEAADPGTRSKCRVPRGGFYLHDSRKGYSHGCIEVDGQFFRDLKSEVDRMRAAKIQRRSMTLRVKYVGETTYGDTFRR